MAAEKKTDTQEQLNCVLFPSLARFDQLQSLRELARVGRSYQADPTPQPMETPCSAAPLWKHSRSGLRFLQDVTQKGNLSNSAAMKALQPYGLFDTR